MADEKRTLKRNGKIEVIEPPIKVKRRRGKYIKFINKVKVKLCVNPLLKRLSLI